MRCADGSPERQYMENNASQVTVCVCTYKRPQLLLSLLNSLVMQTFGMSNFDVVVVDNDKLASARHAVVGFQEMHPELNVRYDVEPMQGISYARNRTVMLSGAELLAFIDDDEIAAPHWLADLVSCMHIHSADAVMGPVIPSYSRDTPRWIIQSRFFERKRFATGIKVGWGDGHTGNALVKTAWAKKRQPHTFDINLARSGGEDADFFKWIESLGGQLTWCDSAIVSEEVPVSRQTLRFMLGRSLIGSVTYWRLHYSQHSMAWRYWNASLGLAKGVLLSVAGVFRLPFGWGRAVKTWTESAKAFGRLAALFGIELVGYGKK